MRDIAIIGLSGRFPGAKNIQEFWQNLKDGRESIRFFTDQELREAGIDESLIKNPDYIKASPVLEKIDQFDAGFFGFSRREAEYLDPQQRFLLECAWETIESAGYIPDQYKGLIGVFAGSGGAVTSYLLHCLIADPSIRGATGSMKHLGNDKDFLSTRVSYKLNLRGPSVAIQSACSTSLVTVHMACQSILAGECDMALAGGVNIRVPHLSGYLRQEGEVFSEDGHCRAFDADATGIVFGSAAGLVLLKLLDEAIADRDTIYAVIKGSAINNDGGPKLSFTSSSATGQIRCMKEALQLADIHPDSLQYVEAHGTGTIMGDPIELSALTQTFRAQTQQKQYCAIGSVKTNVGHLDVAAGVTSLIKTVLSLHHKKIPPSLNFKTPNPKIDFKNSPFFVNTELRDWTASAGPRRAAVNGLGMGGTNAFVILEEAPQQATTSRESKLNLLILSAKSRDALREIVLNYIEYFKAHPDLNLEDVCFTAATGRSHFDERVAISAKSAVEALQKLDHIAKNNFTDIPTEENAKAKRPQSVAMLFSGQGSQYPGMGKELYQNQKVFRDSMDKCAHILNQFMDNDILSIIFPPNQTSEEIHKTQYAQPALFALEYSLYQLWKSWGIEATAVMGHSVGELVAACVAGVFSLEDGLKLIAKRGELMGRLTGDGMMAVVSASEEKVKAALGPLQNIISIAAANGPSNTTISGYRKDLRPALEKLEKEGLRVKELSVSHAFHSVQMEPMLAEFEKLAQTIQFSQPKITIISNLNGRKVTENELASADYWSKHIRNTVRFSDGILSLQQSGINQFLEIGPGTTLVGMGQLCLQDAQDSDEISWLASLKKDSDEYAQVIDSLGKLYCHGSKVNWIAFEGDIKKQKVALPTYPFQRKRYWIDALAQLDAKKITSNSQSSLDQQRFPFLGLRIASATRPNEIIYQSELELTGLREFVKDHIVHEEIVIPAAVYLDIAISAAISEKGPGSVIVENLIIEKPIVVYEGRRKILQTILVQQSPDLYTFQILTCEMPHLDIRSGAPQEEWISNVQGKIRFNLEKVPPIIRENNSELEEIKSRCQQEISIEDFYKVLNGFGVFPKARFKTVKKINGGPAEILSRIEITDEMKPHAHSFSFHPTYLDAFMQLPQAGRMMTENVTRAFLPTTYNKIIYHKAPPAQAWCQMLMRTEANDKVKSLKLDFRGFDDQGDLFIEIQGLTMVEALRESFLKVLGKSDVGAASKEIFYEVQWKEIPRQKTDPVLLKNKVSSTPWLIFSDRNKFGEILSDELKALGGFVKCIGSEVSSKADERQITKILEEFKAEVKSLNKTNLSLPQIVFLNALTEDTVDRIEMTSEQILNEQTGIYGAALNIVQAVLKSSFQLSQISFVTRGANYVHAEDKKIAFAQATLWGLGKVLALEYPEVPCARIDLSTREKSEDSIAEMNSLVQELVFGQDEDQVAFRSTSRLAARLVRSSSPAKLPEKTMIQPDGSYLLTGGLGGIGLATARWLIERGAKSIILLGRQAPNAEAKLIIQELEKRGSKISTYAIDIANEKNIGELFKKMAKDLPPICGILHAAGVLADGGLLTQDWQKFATVMAPKAQGVFNLYKYSKDLNLDFFILFSSATSLIGNRGQANYAAANAFLDSFSAFMKNSGIKSSSVNWSAWAEVGMATRSKGVEKQLSDIGLQALSNQQAFESLSHVIQYLPIQIGVLP